MSPHADGLAGQYRAAEVAGGVKLWSGSSAGGAGRGTSDRMRLHRAGCWGWTKPDSRVKLRGAIFGIQQRALLSCIGMYGCSVAARHAILASRIQCRRDGERGAIYARVSSRSACPGGDALAYLGNLAGSLIPVVVGRGTKRVVGPTWSHRVETVAIRTRRAVGPQDAWDDGHTVRLVDEQRLQGNKAQSLRTGPDTSLDWRRGDGSCKSPPLSTLAWQAGNGVHTRLGYLDCLKPAGL